MVAVRDEPPLGGDRLHLANHPGIPLGLPAGRDERDAEVRPAGRVSEQGGTERSRGLACTRRHEPRRTQHTRAGEHGGGEVVTLVPAVEVARVARRRLDVRDDCRADRVRRAHLPTCSSASHSARLVAASRAGSLRAIFSPSAWASVRNRSGGSTTWLTMPSSYARAAGIRSYPPTSARRSTDSTGDFFARAIVSYTLA